MGCVGVWILQLLWRASSQLGKGQAACLKFSHGLEITYSSCPALNKTKKLMAHCCLQRQQEWREGAEQPRALL